MRLHDAYFFDNDRTVIKAIYRDENDNETERHIPAQESNKKYQAFMNEMESRGGIDRLHERTFEYLRESQSEFSNLVIQIAKERGLVYDIDNIDTDIFKAFAVVMFTKFDPDKDKEKLFMFKLTLFEIEDIKNSKNRELKSQLRKAKNLIDTAEIAIKIVKDTSDTSK